MTNYYEVLGVKQDASIEEIKTSYRALQKKYHPDVYKGDNPDYAAEMVKRANEAYSVLSDEQKRADYDQQLEYGTFTAQGYADPYRQNYGREYTSNPFHQTFYTYTRYRAQDDDDNVYGQQDDQQYPFGFHSVSGRGCLRSLVIMGLIWLGLSLLGIRWIGFPLLFFFF